MTRKQDIAKGSDWKEIWKKGPEGGVQPDWLRGLVSEVVQQVLEGEMDETLRAEKGERTPDAVGIPVGLLHTDAGDASRQADITSASRPEGTVSNGGVRTLSAKRESSGGGAHRDVRARCVDAQGQGSHRAIVWARVFFLDDQPDDGATG